MQSELVSTAEFQFVIFRSCLWRTSVVGGKFVDIFSVFVVFFGFYDYIFRCKIHSSINFSLSFMRYVTW